MISFRLSAGRPAIVGTAVGALLLASTLAIAAEPFPFDQELLLDVRPMRPAKRVPVLMVSANGAATIDLWCKTVKGRVEVSEATIHVEPGPLPDELPQYMSDGQCTPERMQADQQVLADIAQVTEWRRRGDTVVLSGPITLQFRLSSH